MEAEYLSSFTELDNHWWRKGRRDIVLRLVEDFDIPSRSVIDVGCGSGDILEALGKRDFEVFGMDIDSATTRQATSRGIRGVVADGTAIPCDDEQFGVIVASDVLEHIPDQQAALSEWYRVLEPSGLALIFVPAFEWLWSSHDDINNHQRRYTKTRLRNELEEAGFDVIRNSYWNFAISPAAILVKLLDHVRRSEEPQIKETFSPLNKILFQALQIENAVIDRGISMPFGISAFAIARRPVSR